MPGEDRWCTYCGHRFSRDEHLERHILTHSGVKPFRCRLCHMSFARRDLLGRHQTVHGRDENGQETTDINEGIVPKASGRTAVACKSCAKSKTKCDMGFPCARCAQKDIVCVPRTTQRKSRHARKVVTRRQSSVGPENSVSGEASTISNSPTPDPPPRHSQSNRSSVTESQNHSNGIQIQSTPSQSLQTTPAQPDHSLPHQTGLPTPPHTAVPSPPQAHQCFETLPRSLPDDFVFSPSTSPLRPVQSQLEERPIDGPVQSIWNPLMDFASEDHTSNISSSTTTASGFASQIPLSSGFDFFASATAFGGFEDFSHQNPLTGCYEFATSTQNTPDSMSLASWNLTPESGFPLDCFDISTTIPMDTSTQTMYSQAGVTASHAVGTANGSMGTETDQSYPTPSIDNTQLCFDHFDFSMSGSEGWTSVEWTSESGQRRDS